MILFYNKINGEIIGTLEGRVHSTQEVKNAWIQPDNIDKKDIGKYVVPYKKKYKDKKIVELVPAGKLSKLISDYENGKTKTLLRVKIKSLLGYN